MKLTIFIISYLFLTTGLLANPYIDCVRRSLWETGIGVHGPVFGPVTVLEERARPTSSGDYTEKRGMLLRREGELVDSTPVYFLPTEERLQNGLETGFYVSHKDKVYFYELPKQDLANDGYVNRWFLNPSIPGTTKFLYLMYDTLPLQRLKSKYYQKHPNTYPTIKHIAPSYYDYETGKPILKAHLVEQTIQGTAVKDANHILTKIGNYVKNETPKQIMNGMGQLERRFDGVVTSIEHYRRNPTLESNNQEIGPDDSDEPFNVEANFQKYLDVLEMDAKEFQFALGSCLETGVESLVSTASEAVRCTKALLFKIDSYRPKNYSSVQQKH